VKQDVVEQVAEGALGDYCHQSTPRQPTKAEYVRLIEESWGQSSGPLIVMSEPEA